MNKKIAAVAAVVALTGTMAFAGPGEGRGGKHGRQGMAAWEERFGEKLSLTEEQKTQIRLIRENNRTANLAFLEQAKANREAAKAARQAGDTAKFDALKAALQADHERFLELRKAEMEQIRNVLTAEQRAKFDAIRAEHEQRRGERGERGLRGGKNRTPRG
ncbi:MAG TPA: Spy/CpxP family protein refolding chaperone [Thermoanaerobaculia bacterium]|nr:Spy/CpxP family protein refolding chaperone [Thermoanaerobaculia bacterium]